MATWYLVRVAAPYGSPRRHIPNTCVAMAYGLWCAVRRYTDATRSCGASGTRYVTMKGLICSRRVPSG
eukprot:2503813-Prymnesium_polylepis.1